MDLTKIIAKFMKGGLKSLTDEEKGLLTSNISLLSETQKSKYKKEIDADEAADEDEDEEEEEDDDEEKEKNKDEDLDEKALRTLVQKAVNSGINKNVEKKFEKLAEIMVDKFINKAKASREVAIESDKKDKDPNKLETREFLKALMHKDFSALKNHEKALSTAVDGDDSKAGYLIPEELMAEVLRIAQTQFGTARRNMRYLPFSGPGNSRRIPTLGAGIIVTWTDEKGAKVSSQPGFGLITQVLKKLAAIIPFTEEILEDGNINLTQLVAELFQEAIAKEEDFQFLMGVGTPWTGIFNNADINKVEMGAGKGVNDITADDLLDMQDATPSGALPGSKYYLNRQVLSKIRKLKDENKNYIYQRPSEGLPATIWDFPYELNDILPDKNTTGVNKPLVGFGNLKLAAILGDKQQIRTKLLTEATITDTDGETEINLAQQDMVALRLEERVGYVVALPKAFTVLVTGDAS